MALWGTVIGILGGAVQDGISYIRETKTKEQELKHSIELEKVRSENKIKEFQAGIKIEEERTKQADFSFQAEEQKTFGIKAQSEASVDIEKQKTEAIWYENLSKATQYIQNSSRWANIANFFIATARPLITYLLGYLMFWIVFNHEKFTTTPEWLQQFITMMGFQFEATVSFWFYRRGSDRMVEIQNQKKK